MKKLMNLGLFYLNSFGTLSDSTYKFEIESSISEIYIVGKKISTKYPQIGWPLRSTSFCCLSEQVKCLVKSIISNIKFTIVLAIH